MLAAVVVVSVLVVVNSINGHRANTPSKSATVVVSLPVVRCPTEVGASRGAHVHLAKNLKESVDRDLTSKIALYVDQYDVMRAIGPKGWSCVASIAADGGAQLSIYAPGTHAPLFFGSFVGRSSATEVTVQQEPVCEGCRLAMACPFFTSARHLFQKSFPGAGTSTICVSPSGERITKSTKQLRYFQDPPRVIGHAFPSGGPYRASGVAFYNPDTYSFLVSCTLSTSLAKLCPGVLAWFVRHHRPI
jgi:hypothetical protein